MIGTVKTIFDALKEPLAAAGRWLNPDRRREARKDKAIEAARELFLIYRTLGKLPGDKGAYHLMREDKVKKHEIHWLKVFNACEQG